MFLKVKTLPQVFACLPLERVRSRNSESMEETPERKDHVTFRHSSVDQGMQQATVSVG